ncbi:MAG: hypothetical protein VKJ04_09715 [Vampirovibrionales bacterium]|nr:hypothetical protein [Vampirovibrionales bacterium]
MKKGAKPKKFESIRPKSKPLTGKGLKESWLDHPQHHRMDSGLNRASAIANAIGLIGKSGQDSKNPAALSLIELFNLTPEELCEAGLSYEAIKALEQNCLSWRMAR